MSLGPDKLVRAAASLVGLQARALKDAHGVAIAKELVRTGSAGFRSVRFCGKEEGSKD